MNRDTSPTAKLRRPIVWEDADTLVAHSDPWLIKGLIPAVGVAVLSGKSGEGKSFVALDVLSRICRGETALGGRKTKKTGVGYLAAEGVNGVRKRLQGLRQAGSMFGTHFFLADAAIDLSNDDSVSDIKVALKKLQIQLPAGAKLGVVAIDTLSASIPGADENSAKDMSKVLQAIGDLARTFQICIILVAHVGKDAGKGLRGWSGLTANVDAVLTIARVEADTLRSISMTKVKDGDPGPDLFFALKVIDLGADEDGDRITTCVVDWHEQGSALPQRRQRKISAGAGLVKRLIGRLEDRDSSVLVIAAGAPLGQRGVRLDDLRQAWADNNPVEKGTNERRQADARRKTLANRLISLEAAQIIRNEDGVVWLTADKPTEVH